MVLLTHNDDTAALALMVETVHAPSLLLHLVQSLVWSAASRIDHVSTGRAPNSFNDLLLDGLTMQVVVLARCRLMRRRLFRLLCKAQYPTRQPI